MRFLLDQSSDARLVLHLQAHGHDATRIGRDHPGGLSDAQVLAIAHAERRILITDDRDFGELVFRLRQSHAGVIFLRLGAYADLPTRVERLDHVLTHYADEMGEFLVVSRRNIRVRRR
jgi:predicted nuclease of predicted toxin-antitoxin system